jgi:gluconolactonase
MDLETRDPRFRAIVDQDAGIAQIGTGFRFVEGPVWHAGGEFLLFSDIAGDTIRRWTADEGIAVFRAPSNMANGLAFDRHGGLLICEHATSRLVRLAPDGETRVLASHFEGRELNSPNDVVVSRDGAVYFTDPSYGRREFYGIPRPQELPFQGVYRIDPDGELHLLADDFEQPNGLCLSLDERRLFVNDTPRQHIRVFDLTLSRTLANGSLWARTVGAGRGAPDGMKIDVEGNLYCCGPGGIHVFSPDATCLGVLPMPEKASNFAWGGDGLCDLFITASASLYRTRLRIPGTPRP